MARRELDFLMNMEAAASSTVLSPSDPCACSLCFRLPQQEEVGLVQAEISQDARSHHLTGESKRWVRLELIFPQQHVTSLFRATKPQCYTSCRSHSWQNFPVRVKTVDLATLPLILPAIVLRYLCNSFLPTVHSCSPTFQPYLCPKPTFSLISPFISSLFPPGIVSLDPASQVTNFHPASLVLLPFHHHNIQLLLKLSTVRFIS